jgi:aminopeptidase N
VRVLARIFAMTALLASIGVQLPAPPPPPPTGQVITPDPLNKSLSAPQSAKAVSNANYRIEATLDPRRRAITGRETLTWRNVSANPATTLQFHLYYNAWRDNRSSWMKEARLAEFPVWITAETAGSIEVTGIRVLRQDITSDLTSRMRFLAPDDGNGDDRTVLEVPLDHGVAPGETINIDIEWTSKIPRPIARTGAIGNFFFIAQWFPKIGVLEDGGWNCHQFHATTEFYSDFGVYDVKLTVPRGWMVGATGRERTRLDTRDGNTTHHYYQEDVHDFAWTTSPDYIERRERFDHPTLPPVEMRLLLQPEHASQARRHFDAVRAALRYYGEWFGPYPYGHITIVDPAYQSGAGGMEYPTLFTAGTSWLAPQRVSEPEDVIVHEAGHQFWYGMVATNEFEHAWMDEGLNTFSTARVIDQAYPANFHAERFFGGFVPWVTGLRIPRGAQQRTSLAAASGDDPSRPSWRYWPRASAAISYSKTAVALQTLERLIGWEGLRRGMSTYFTRHAFGHPTPDDFFAAVNESAGQDLRWFWDQVFRSSAEFDYSLEFLESNAVGDRFRTTVVARRIGEGRFPVDVRVVFVNGEEHRWQWDGSERWKSFETERTAAAAWAQVDPNDLLVLDARRTNNSYTLTPRSRQAARKWSLAWLIWLQDHLLTYGFFV